MHTKPLPSFTIIYHAFLCQWIIFFGVHPWLRKPPTSTSSSPGRVTELHLPLVRHLALAALHLQTVQLHHVVAQRRQQGFHGFLWDHRRRFSKQQQVRTNHGWYKYSSRMKQYSAKLSFDPRILVLLPVSFDLFGGSRYVTVYLYTSFSYIFQWYPHKTIIINPHITIIKPPLYHRII